MTRNCHNYRLLTDSLHLKEGTSNTDIYNIIKVKQPTIFLVKMITEQEKKIENKGRYKTSTTNRNNNKQSFQHPHIISEILRYFIINESDLIEHICYLLLYTITLYNKVRNGRRWLCILFSPFILYFIYCDECEQVRHNALAASE